MIEFNCYILLFSVILLKTNRQFYVFVVIYVAANNVTNYANSTITNTYHPIP